MAARKNLKAPAYRSTVSITNYAQQYQLTVYHGQTDALAPRSVDFNINMEQTGCTWRSDTQDSRGQLENRTGQQGNCIDMVGLV